MRFRFTLVLLSVVFLWSGFAEESIAQRKTGVHWNVPDNQQKALNELEILKESGITYLEIDEALNDALWEKVEELHFRVFASLPIHFPITQTFARPDSALLAAIRTSVNAFIPHPQVKAIGLFSHGAVDNADFTKAVLPFAKEIRNAFEEKLYYTTTRTAGFHVDSFLDFRMQQIVLTTEFKNTEISFNPSQIGAFSYKPSEKIAPFISPVKWFLEKASPDSIPVFFESTWLLQAFEQHPGFQSTIKLYNSDSDFVFPVPEESLPKPGNHSLIVLLLLAIWGTFAIIYNLSPVYRKSLMRYFTSHTFFVKDVMERHLRSIGPAVTVLVQHLLLTGISAYSISSIYFSPLGFKALFYHYPVLSLGTNFLLAFFIWGCLLSLLLTLVCIIWIYFSNKQIKQFNQVINLYAWPLQLNFFSATLIVTLLAAGNFPVIITMLIILFVLITLSAFIVASLDASSHLQNLKAVFILGTVGIYSIMWLSLAIWVFSNSYLTQALQLAVSLF